ncbi:hypothetical protein SAMN02745866_04247 [Alteromonadaceae bacterium Bs31]|nr:hypothetical protein SAMN02745866_04247 [Alteromonadaceae bacterium Bs31]
MGNFIRLSVLALILQGCTYGYVHDASNGSAISAATVRVVKGSCSGAGCGSPNTEQTSTSGLYVFDAYGDVNGAANVKLIYPASGEEAIELLISKPGFRSRTLFHRPKYEQVESGDKTYYIAQAPKVFLCSWSSVDSDGDSICDAAEARYGTNPYSSDTDGDRISDAAELFGINGVDLRYFGENAANPRRKDVFMEIDYYPGLKPDQAAIDTVIEAFANAPVSNHDGSMGISLNVDLNQQISASDADSDLNPVWTDFDLIKNKYFSSRRNALFHYALFANQFNSGGWSGISRGIPGHDFIVSLGTWSTPGGTLLQQTGTLMHEFGHNLGLMHGGNQNRNYKPNYLSVMSYSYQMRGLRIGGVDGNIDYSRLKIASVNESNLNEFTAFSPIAPTTSTQLSQYGVRDRTSWLNGNANTNLDFDKDGTLEASVSADLDGNGSSSDIFSASQNDWDNLVFHGGGTIGDSMLGATAGLKFLSRKVDAHDMEQCMTEFD